MRIFLSYAAAELPWATRVVNELDADDLGLSLDRYEVAPGSSSVQVLSNALERADYCLLLWSKLASEHGWLHEEWQAAFHRSVEEQRTFLIMARVEDFPLPRLLQHRLWVDLFTDFAAGMKTLHTFFNNDRAVSQSSGRPVIHSAAKASALLAGAEIYVTSQLFGYTTPVRVNLQEPSAMVVERFIRDTELPKQVAHNTTMGFHVSYAFTRDGQRLDPARSLADQGVSPGHLLWLETRLQPFAAVDPISGHLISTTFRLTDATTRVAEISRGRDVHAHGEARKELLLAIRRAGLR
jgi:TIR domain